MVSYQLAPLFWRAIGILELNCDLHVVATSSDGMSANRKFYRLHKYVLGEESKIVNKTMNIFAPQRNIWFFADVPHLMKTTRGNILRPILSLGLKTNYLLLKRLGLHCEKACQVCFLMYNQGYCDVLVPNFVGFFKVV